MYQEVQNKYVSTANIDQKIIFLKTMILVYQKYFYLVGKITFVEFCLKEFAKYSDHLRTLLRSGKVEFEFSRHSLHSHQSQSATSLDTSLVEGGCLRKHNCHFARINRVLLKFKAKSQVFTFCCICARFPNEAGLLDEDGKWAGLMTPDVCVCQRIHCLRYLLLQILLLFLSLQTPDQSPTNLKMIMYGRTRKETIHKFLDKRGLEQLISILKTLVFNAGPSTDQAESVWPVLFIRKKGKLVIDSDSWQKQLCNEMTLCLEILAECLKNTKSQYEELMLLVPKPSVRKVLFRDQMTNLLFFCLNLGSRI